MNKFRRCRIGSEIFGSSMSSRHVNSSSDDEHETCTVELWRSEFYHESRDCIIPVHHILGWFIPVKYKISDRQNAVEYLAINPINRKYHIKYSQLPL
ncbi:hypothetical protein RhiirA5_446833 [Rhizophagus irregularis]|uniref:Uncharacterized protein n=1 Tax=Rhizophagus irregularis TaxID=588596 RepID=A0A2N0NBK6_9GLOM|nr:hypothetical protein RhiirA5_446833 [Rhizophagus irregularis]